MLQCIPLLGESQRLEKISNVIYGADQHTSIIDKHCNNIVRKEVNKLCRAEPHSSFPLILQIMLNVKISQSCSQKLFWSNTILTYQNLVPNKICSEIFWDNIFFVSENILGPKNVGSVKDLSLKKCWVQQKFGPKMIGPKKCGSQEKWYPKKGGSPKK